MGPEGARWRRGRQPDTRAARSPSAGVTVLIPLILVPGWAALLAWGAWTEQLPLWLLGALLAINLLTFATYAADKRAAQRGGWRTREKNLHLLSLAGGWPAAWFAQQTLRHKSRKAAFRAVYWVMVTLHCCALAAWVLGRLG
ncbi:hypothetical protein CBP36_10145 [Acidovorax carolinensis]|uniref:Cold-shock protein n=1 Tax=Acidovorax carolinensis TaxID=553814 RepID=A0A240UH87_9BURK|nr:hypothetical protein CBP36_10145 [Acidovorax carolinensis]